MEPSPTAEATRFTFPDRASPTTKTPGRLVSSIREAVRRATEPAARNLKIAAGQNEAFVVEGHASRKPVGLR